MNLNSRTDWTPISRERFENILRDEVAGLPSDALRMYQASVIPIAEYPCFRTEQYGNESVFVVARSGEQVILFDDVEDEFGIGRPNDEGVLREWSSTVR